MSDRDMYQTNPFLSDSLFVGRTREMEELRAYLSSGRSALLIGGRRAGKTRLASRLGVEGIGRPIIQIDINAWQLTSERALIQQIGILLGEQRCDSREELTEALRQRCPLALFLDEFDQILSQPWAGSFLSYMRWLDGTELRQGISFLLIGGPSLAGYRNPDDRGSPPLNLSEPVYLEPLDEAARSLLVSMVGCTIAAPDILREAGGHPWLLTRLLAELWSHGDLERAVERIFEIAVMSHFPVWKQQLGKDGVSLLCSLPEEGVTRLEFRPGRRLGRYNRAFLLARCVCAVICEKGRVHLGPKLFHDWLKQDSGQGVESTKEQPPRGHTAESRTLRVFCSYAPEDEGTCRRLEAQLVLLRRQGVITIWHDRRLLGGDVTRDRTDEMLKAADIILLLISADFFKSDYLWDVELKGAMEKHKARTARVIPVLLRALPPGGLPYEDLSCLPRNGKPVSQWEDTEDALCDVACAIAELAGQLVQEG